MQNIISIIQDHTIKAAEEFYQTTFSKNQVPVSTTRKELEGDYTVVVFPFVKAARKKPEDIATELGNSLKENVEYITGFNVVKGFLNLTISDAYWNAFLLSIGNEKEFGRQPRKGEKVMVEFSSPNTNKPLHLGHIRNILLGWSSAQIQDAIGYDVVKVQIVNDRGIAICKSMLAWQKFGNDTTPSSEDMKPDHFVGKYYVIFDQKFKAEYVAWQESETALEILNNWKSDEKTLKRAVKSVEEAKEKARQEAEKKGETFSDGEFTVEKYFYKEIYKNTYFNEYSEIGEEARTMLQAWENNDPATRTLWEKMNGWVYEGFNTTYETLGVSFDQLYYESETYLLGKDIVESGIEKGVFYTCEDGSIEADLTDVKLDKKKLLRSDGTSLYITQDLGTAHQRYEDHGVKSMTYVVGDEQIHHFKVLFELLKRLDEPYAEGLYHLAYGMVELPTGKMKSREGTVVDADDLVAEVVEEVRKNSQERDTLNDLTKEEQAKIIHQVGLAALKFFMIKVHPKKWMTFDPKESVDLQGQTGPYIQNAYVRVQAVLRKAGTTEFPAVKDYLKLEKAEKEIILQLFSFPQVLELAAAENDPSNIAQYCYNLAKSYHRLYHDHSILNAESDAAKDFRLMLSQATANSLKFGMQLLGIEMPQRM